MKKKITIIVSGILVLLLVFAGCAKMGSDDMASEPQVMYKKAEVNAEMAEEAGFGGMDAVTYNEESVVRGEGELSPELIDNPEELSEKIIYNVHASLLCEDVEIAVAAITEKTKSLGGYVSYANTYNSDGYSYASIEIRIPSQNLDVMEQFSHEIGNVEEYTMSTDNITESYYDILARLEHSIVQEEQLLEIMKKAVTIEETLLVRAELDKVQERIESYKGRIKVWDSLVDYSTVTYNIRPIPTLDNDSDDSPRIIKLDETWRAMKRGFINSSIAVANFFSFLLRALAVLAIPLIICGVVAIAVVILVKRGRGKKNDKQ